MGYEVVIRQIYAMNNYTLDQEVLNVLLDTSQHKLISAPAGGTKTSLTQAIVCMEKLRLLVWGNKINANIPDRRDQVETTYSRSQILCLVYNKHNVDDIESIHNKMFNTFVTAKYFKTNASHSNYSAAGVTGSTMHGFAVKVIQDNLPALNLRSFEFSDEKLLQGFFSSAVTNVLKKHQSTLKPTSQFVADCKQLYDLYIGLQLYKTAEEQPLTDSVQFELVLQGMDMPSKYLREIFNLYEATKKRFRLNEFSDALRILDTLLDNEQIRTHYQNYYRIIVADEVQDFTPLMFSIYRKLVGPKTKTITVGDSNQSIYSFLGAEVDVLDRFEELMGYSPRRFNLTVNRRCKEDTMAFARNTLAKNGVDGEAILTTKNGGEIDFRTFKTPEEQVMLINHYRLTHNSGDLAILFRTKDESVLLSRHLYNNNVRVNYINAKHFAQHSLYTMFINLVRQLFLNKTHEGLAMLHWITPFSKQAVEDFFQFDPKTKISATVQNAQLWHLTDLQPLYGNRDFFEIDEQVQFIKDVAENSTSKIASEVIPRLATMFFHNFYKFLPFTKEDSTKEAVLQWLIEDLSKGYDISRTIDLFEKELYKNISLGRRGADVNITTIHGTKGLEFNHVILNLIGAKTKVGKNLTPQALLFQEQEENRLLYVASTRQKDSLLILTDERNPHRLANESMIVPAKKKEIPRPAYDPAPEGIVHGGIQIGVSSSNRRRRSLLEED